MLNKTHVGSNFNELLEQEGILEGIKATTQYNKLVQQNKDLQKEINKLASFILNEVNGEPSQNEGAADTAIRIIKTQSKMIELMAEYLVDHTFTNRNTKESLDYFKQQALQELEAENTTRF